MRRARLEANLRAGMTKRVPAAGEAKLVPENRRPRKVKAIAWVDDTAGSQAWKVSGWPVIAT